MGIKNYKIITFGCQMNLADSGALAAVLDSRGYTPVESLDEADLVIINTCSVRQKAEERVFGRLGELRPFKNGTGKKIAVVGCMAQRLGDRILERAPHVDYILGTDRMFDLPEILDDRPGIPRINTEFGHEGLGEILPARDSKYSAFVTISRGCDNYCSYCIVPYVRGRERSLKRGKIIDQARAFAAEGVLEITLLGQNVNSYRDDGHDFAALMKDLALQTDIARIRFMTSHPKDLSERLIEVMASEPRIMPHLHLPLQSGSDIILERMGRLYTLEHYLGLVEKLRAAIPDLSLTTDLIVGFPGETEADFEKTLEAVRLIKYDSAFMFRYSIREGTAAAKFIDDVPEPEKIARLMKLIDTQKEISYARNQAEIGAVRQTLVDGRSRRNQMILKGKTEKNITVLMAGEPTHIGTIRPVKITSADSWTLHGEFQG